MRVKWGQTLTAGLGWSLLWFCLIQVPQIPAGTDPDRSWGEAYSYFFKHRFQAGQDYIFTYGPLGHFLSQVYDPELYWITFGWELSFKALLASILIWVISRTPGKTRKLLLWLVIGLTMLWPERNRQNQDGVLVFIELSLFASLVRANGTSLIRQLLPTLAIFVLFGLMKFTLFLFGIVSMGLFICVLCGRRQFVSAAIVALSYLCCFLLGWALAGQSISHLPAWVGSSMEITRGYEQAMGSPSTLRETWFVTSGLLSVALLGCILVPIVKQHRDSESIATGLLLSFAVFMAWKHGFVRADTLHLMGFFRSISWILLALPALFPAGLTYQTAGAGNSSSVRLFNNACTFIGALSCVPGFVMSSPGYEEQVQPAVVRHSVRSRLSYLISPLQYRAWLQELRDELRHKHDLPNVREQVGRATIDIISWEQGVLFLNELNWKPRPIFQSYSAYTGWLTQQNLKYFSEESGPAYLL